MWILLHACKYTSEFFLLYYFIIIKFNKVSPAFIIIKFNKVSPASSATSVPLYALLRIFHPKKVSRDYVLRTFGRRKGFKKINARRERQKKLKTIKRRRRRFLGSPILLAFTLYWSIKLRKAALGAWLVSPILKS